MGAITIRRALTTLALALSLAGTLAGCGTGSTVADEAAKNGILLVGNGADPRTLDPQLLIGSPEANIVSALSEGLVVQDPDDVLKVRPGVAEKWSHSPDYRRWTFQLRPNAKWSDGSPVTARDFVYSFRRMLTPELDSDAADLLHVIRNARAYNLGEIDDFGEVGIAAPDPLRLELTLEYPAPYLLTMLAGTNFMPVNRAAVEAGGAMGDRNNRWASAGTYVGNGPFLLSEWHVNRYILLERNPQYWDAANVRLNGVRFVPIESPSDEVDGFLAGDLHVTQAIPQERRAELLRDHRASVVEEELLGTESYELNVRKPPLDDVRVRKALALAIDRAALVRALDDGLKPVGGFVPPGMAGYRAIPAPVPDIARARALLAEAGFPGGRGFPKMSVLVNRYPLHQDIAHIVTAQWKQALGIDVGVRVEQWRDYLDSTGASRFDIARSGWVANYFDPGTFLDLLLSRNPNNGSGWADPAYDALLTGARQTPEPDRRMMLMRQAEDLMLAQQPVIPLIAASQTYLLDPRVKGWGNSIGGNRVYKFISFATN